MKILKDQPIPEKRTTSHIVAMVKQMQVGDCIECNNERDAQAVCITIRQLGLKPVRRKVADKMFRVWMTAVPTI
mgnify:FL=1|jgi:hypothetical protein|tara:strand:- start:167 stop:388 length:222 start_codon:yes stop_codon:yes gene_type:complete